ncbi:MAG: nucleotidyl transferase AbiEii/AbiGii toxin family protein [Clostridiales bacterium]|nr:nucleotidyl transferase AbiEii/AbiGii toxin family protein [Clostridiales bacterium]
MSAKMPNSRRNLDIAIDRVFGAEQNPLQIRTLIANTIIGQLLPSGVVKGGSALKLRYGDKTTRFTRDLDADRADELKVFLEQFDVALKAGWNGFTGRVVRKEPAKPKGIPGEYIMQPFEVKLAYNGKSWATVLLEIGHDEVGSTETCDCCISQDVVALFERLGFPAPNPVALLQTHHQIAQKLHALSAVGSERAHDLVDLQVIAKSEDIDHLLTKNVCKRLFASRGQQGWPPTISKGDAWDTLYKSQIGELDVFQNVEDAIKWTNGLIKAIDEAGTE